MILPSPQNLTTSQSRILRQRNPCLSVLFNIMMDNALKERIIEDGVVLQYCSLTRDTISLVDYGYAVHKVCVINLLPDERTVAHTQALGLRRHLFNADGKATNSDLPGHAFSCLLSRLESRSGT